MPFTNNADGSCHQSTIAKSLWGPYIVKYVLAKDVDLPDGCITQPLGSVLQESTAPFVSPAGQLFDLAKAALQRKGDSWELGSYH